IDERGVGGEDGVHFQLVLEEARLEAVEPRIDEDGLVAEGDLPAIGAEPREVDTGRTRPAPTRRRLHAFRCAGREQRPSHVRSGREGPPPRLPPGSLAGTTPHPRSTYRSPLG